MARKAIGWQILMILAQEQVKATFLWCWSWGWALWKGKLSRSRGASGSIVQQSDLHIILWVRVCTKEHCLHLSPSIFLLFLFSIFKSCSLHFNSQSVELLKFIIAHVLVCNGFHSIICLWFRMLCALGFSQGISSWLVSFHFLVCPQRALPL